MSRLGSEHDRKRVEMLNAVKQERNQGTLSWFRTPTVDLHPCVYVEIICSMRCQLVYRSVLETSPEGALTNCPKCNHLCGWNLLGIGKTTVPLPVHEKIDPSGRLTAIDRVKPRIPWGKATVREGVKL